MRRAFLLAGVLVVLSGSILAPSYSMPGGEPHPLIRRAVMALRAAKMDLQNAAHDFCGHRVEALEATNNALEQLQAALACDRKKVDSGFAGLDVAVAPRVPGGEPHPRIYNAISALGAAEGDLQNAAHDYCGHRVESLKAVQNALAQLRASIACDKK